MNAKQKRSGQIYWNLFHIYYNGIGVKKNMKKAVFYLKKSNSYQYSLATITLGNFYFSGKLIKKNISMAIGLWEKFASDYYKYHQSRFHMILNIINILLKNYVGYIIHQIIALKLLAKINHILTIKNPLNGVF